MDYNSKRYMGDYSSSRRLYTPPPQTGTTTAAASTGNNVQNYNNRQQQQPYSDRADNKRNSGRDGDTLKRKREEEDREKSETLKSRRREEIIADQEVIESDSCCGLLPVLLCRRAMDLLDMVSLGLVVAAFTAMLASTAVTYLGILLSARYLCHHLWFVSPYFVAVPHYLVAVGVITILCSLYGICAGSSRNRCHLSVLASIYVALFVAQLICVFLANELRIIVESQPFLQSDVTTFASDYRTSTGDAWDALQNEYVCCGGFDRNEGFNFWKDHLDYKSVPDSCCLEQGEGCGKDIFDKVSRGQLHLHLLSRGCMRVIEDTLIAEVAPLLQAYVVGGLILSFLKVVSAFLCCCGADHIRRQIIRNRKLEYELRRIQVEEEENRKEDEEVMV